MNKQLIRIAALALLGLPLAAFAWGRVGVGVHVGGYYGPHYGYGPRYGYYGPRWYGGYYAPYYWYGPDYGYYYYPPPAQVYAPPEDVVEQPAPAYWYYCVSAKNYFPYVNACPEGWQAVPAQSAPAPQDQPPQASAQPAPPPPAPAGRVVYRLGDLLFATDQVELQAAATATLDGMIASIAKEPNRRIVVEGHTDSVGDSAHNRELSQRRADAVRQYLIAHGVAADRISAVGKGEADPIASNDTADGRKHNRRVDVIVS